MVDTLFRREHWERNPGHGWALPIYARIGQIPPSDFLGMTQTVPDFPGLRLAGFWEDSMVFSISFEWHSPSLPACPENQIQGLDGLGQIPFACPITDEIWHF